MGGLLSPSASGCVQFERPQEVRGVFESAADGEDFVDEIFDANDVRPLQLLFDDGVRRDRDALVVDFGKTAFVHQLKWQNDRQYHHRYT